jgi:enediyne biosynthesis protein E4
VNKWAYLQELATGNDYHLRRVPAWPYFRTASPKDKSTAAQAVPNDKLSGDSHLAFFARPDGRGAFSEIGAQLGFPKRTVSRGIAVGDIDHDGRVDFVLANQWEDSQAYFNEAATAGNFLGLRVVRPAGDNPAEPGAYSLAEFQARGWTAAPVIGARVVVEKTSREPVGIAMVDGGNGHSGRRPAEIHLGVGAIRPDEALDVRVQWRPATTAHNGWTSFAGKLRAGPPGKGAAAGWWVIVVGGMDDAK